MTPNERSNARAGMLVVACGHFAIAALVIAAAVALLSAVLS